MDEVRIDKWLWAARFFKTRSMATDAVVGGRVHLNDERVKPSKAVHVGDTLVVTIGTLRRTVVVTALGDRRGSATAAAALYEETPESVAAREQHVLERRLAPSARRRPRRAPDEAVAAPARRIAPSTAPPALRQRLAQQLLKRRPEGRRFELGDLEWLECPAGTSDEERRSAADAVGRRVVRVARDRVGHSCIAGPRVELCDVDSRTAPATERRYVSLTQPVFSGPWFEYMR